MSDLWQRVFAPMMVYSVPVRPEDLVKVAEGLANLPPKFEMVEFMRLLPDNLEQVVKGRAADRLLQRWRKMGFLVFQSGRWRMPQGAWERLQKCVSDVYQTRELTQ